jgi:hypothetical protein
VNYVIDVYAKLGSICTGFSDIFDNTAAKIASTSSRTAIVIVRQISSSDSLFWEKTQCYTLMKWITLTMANVNSNDVKERTQVISAQRCAPN